MGVPENLYTHDVGRGVIPSYLEKILVVLATGERESSLRPECVFFICLNESTPIENNLNAQASIKARIIWRNS